MAMAARAPPASWAFCTAPAVTIAGGGLVLVGTGGEMVPTDVATDGTTGGAEGGGGGATELSAGGGGGDGGTTLAGGGWMLTGGGGGGG